MMKYRFLMALSLFMLLGGCTAPDEPAPKESHYLQNAEEPLEDSIIDAGSSDGAADGTTDGEPDGTTDGEPDGTTDGSSDGTTDGSSDGSMVDAGPVTGPEGYDVQLDIGAITLGDPNTVEITIHNGVEVAGFQFNLSGAAIARASDDSGLIANMIADGFMVTASQQTVLGFDMGGSVTLAPSHGVLMVLEIGTPTEDALCILSPVMSDSDGEGLTTTLGPTNGCKPVP